MSSLVEKATSLAKLDIKINGFPINSPYRLIDVGETYIVRVSGWQSDKVTRITIERPKRIVDDFELNGICP